MKVRNELYLSNKENNCENNIQKMISLKQNQIEELEKKMEDFNKDRLREEMKGWNNYPF